MLRTESWTATELSPDCFGESQLATTGNREVVVHSHVARGARPTDEQLYADMCAKDLRQGTEWMIRVPPEGGHSIGADNPEVLSVEMKKWPPDRDEGAAK